MEFDFTTFIFFIISVIVFLNLRKALGKRTGHEKPRHRETIQKPDRRSTIDDDGEHDGDSKVITLPRRDKNNPDRQPDIYANIDKYADIGTALNQDLRAIVDQDPQFAPKQFIDGAQMAYEMIVTAFADGDKKSLKSLLSREVYEGFTAAINERESRGEQIKASFVGVEKADIIAAEVSGRNANVTLSVVSQIISATLDKDENVIDGSLEDVAEVKDIWTFSRDLKSKDPNWRLIATESES